MPADGKRSVIVYMHGGAFLTCGANTHGRLVTALSRYADSPVLVVNYRMIPKHSVGQALDDCYDAYKWLRLRGYDPEQIAALPSHTSVEHSETISRDTVDESRSAQGDEGLNQANRLERLIDDLLEVSALEAGKPNVRVADGSSSGGS